MDNMQFPILFSPISIKDLTLKNRIVMPPMCTNYATIGGAVTERIISYYAERAKGGVGLIDVEFTYVAWEGKVHEYMLGIYDDRLIPGLKRLTDAIQEWGARVAIQLSHGGRRANSEIIGSLPVAPSIVPRPAGETPRELTVPEIGEIIHAFISAARRAKKAGFDAVMLHMAHGYLINQFLSPYTNKRCDRYGGDLEGHARFALEILRGVRKEVGDDFPITCRFCGDEYLKGGIDATMAVEIAKLLEANGIDAIEVSSGSPDAAITSSSRPPNVPMGFLADLSHEIKKAVSVPVGTVGRIHSPRVAEALLQEGKADLIAVGRGLIADPEWPKKAMEGKTEEICPCISCNDGCSDRMHKQLDVSCTVNPLVGREKSYSLEIAEHKKKIVILGGGPAGLEAARIAAMRGHKVRLYEKEKDLGGQLRIASVPPDKEMLEELRKFLVREATRLGVGIIHEFLDQRAIKKFGPDEIVVATGGTPKLLDVPGTNQNTVLSAWEVLLHRKSVGLKTAIIGGGQVGLETADFLLTKERQITIIEMLDQAGQDMNPRARKVVITKLIENGAEIISQAKVVAIEKDRIVFDRKGLRERTESFDSIVVAVGTVSRASDLRGLEKMGIPIRFVGDCLGPRKLFDAIHEGFLAGIEI